MCGQFIISYFMNTTLVVNHICSKLLLLHMNTLDGALNSRRTDMMLRHLHSNEKQQPFRYNSHLCFNFPLFGNYGKYYFTYDASH